MSARSHTRNARNERIRIKLRRIRREQVLARRAKRRRISMS